MAKDWQALTTSALGEDGIPRRRRPTSYEDSVIDVDLPDTDNIQELCRAATPYTTRRLIKMALDPGTDDKNTLVAIKEIHDRAYGKSTQMVEGRITMAQIDRDIAELERLMLEKGIDLEAIDIEEVEVE